jgi:hypothetical protein
MDMPLIVSPFDMLGVDVSIALQLALGDERTLWQMNPVMAPMMLSLVP